MSPESDLTQTVYGSSNISSPVRADLRHRKRSSSLFALAELRIPSPPLTPSVSINFSSRDSSATGEIPIIFDFLTTGSMPSEERIAKMASLRPALPPLIKFSPMSAFFPMSDSSDSLNTISTDAFGTKRPRTDYSETSQRRYSMLSDYSSVYSPLSSDFNLPSPTEAVNHEAHDGAQNAMAQSASMPAVHVRNYDVGQKELGDISNFTISAYLTSSEYDNASGSLASISLGDECNILPRPILSEDGSRVSPSLSANGLLSVSTTPDLDDKTPTQSTFMKRRTLNETPAAFPFPKLCHEASEAGMTISVMAAEVQPPGCGESLMVPPSPDFDDKTPTQTTFLKRPTGDQDVSLSCPSRAVGTARAGRMCMIACSETGDPSSTVADVASLLTTPGSPDFDDKTPTQATFLQRQGNLDPLPLADSPQHIAHVDGTDATSLPTSSRVDTATLLPSFRDKELPAKPADEESFEISEQTTTDSTVSRSSVMGTVLPIPCLRHARWLRDTIVELWIDQEGFRAIRPKFFLASVSNGLLYSQDHTNPSSSLAEPTEEHDPLYTTVAEFLPVSRAAHLFHHAPLDRGPTLRRITTGDETKDCITRAATISLRDNGVFFVQGTEDHHIGSVEDNPGGPSGGGRIVRLNWRFEYFVSSRRPDGRSAHKGEKVITPLSFSCNPALLDRTRAHKVTVLHIMKKTLLPNLIAQKLEPPDLPLLQTSGSGWSLASSLMTQMTQSIPADDPEIWGTVTNTSPKSIKSTVGKQGQAMRSRRGSGSEYPQCADTGVGDNKSTFTPPRLKPPPRPPLPYTKHRRGSHSDTTPEDFMLQQQRNRSDSHATHERSRSASILQRGRGGGGLAGEYTNAAGAHGISGPIIPQGELMKMLDSSSSPVPAAHVDSDRRPHSIRVEVVNNVQVTTLPAPPRHRYNP